MYVQRIIYEGCCSFQDISAQGSAQVDSLFNLTQNYYLIVSEESATDVNESTSPKD